MHSQYITLGVLFLFVFGTSADTTEVHSIATIRLRPDGSVFVGIDGSLNTHRVIVADSSNNALVETWLAILRIAMETERQIEITYPDSTYERVPKPYSFSKSEYNTDAISLRIGTF